MDVQYEEYNKLTKKIKQSIPVVVYPGHELLKVSGNLNADLNSRTELTLVKVMNSGEEAGIMCVVETEHGSIMNCPLTQLVFSVQHPLYEEILEYQKKRRAM